jgi:outer membrane receptor protein involved in Fe transport
MRHSGRNGGRRVGKASCPVSNAVKPAGVVSLRVYNLFDELYVTSSYGTAQYILGMPRTAQLAVNVKF